MDIDLHPLIPSAITHSEAATICILQQEANVSAHNLNVDVNSSSYEIILPRNAYQGLFGGFRLQFWHNFTEVVYEGIF